MSDEISVKECLEKINVNLGDVKVSIKEEWLDQILSRLRDDPVIPFHLFCGLIHKESCWNPEAIGKSNDTGLCQITPIGLKDANALLSKLKKRTYSLSDCKNPKTCIDVAWALLVQIRDRFVKTNRDFSDWDVVSAYNVGFKAYCDGTIVPDYAGKVFEFSNFYLI